MNLLFYINECRNCLFRHKMLTISLIILFLSSTMCGIILEKPTVIFDYYLAYCENYTYKIFSVNASVFSIFTGRCISNILFFAVVCVSSSVVFLFPLHIFIVFYRGFIFGIELVILCTCYSVSGFFVALLLVFPQGIIFAAILILSAPFSFECGLQTYHSRSLIAMREYFCWLIFFLSIALLSAVLESLTVIILFKPFIFVL